jgi:hypothetical protein
LRSGCFFAFRKFVGFDFSQTILYLNRFSWETTRRAVKMPCEVRTITPPGFTTRRHARHSLSRGMRLSQRF